MCESGFTTLSHRRERQIANSVRMSIKNHQISKLIEDKTHDSCSAKPRSTKPGCVR
jgi:hypothetical protein